MSKNNSKKLNMKENNLVIAPEDDELFSLTDSDDSSSSSDQVFEKNQMLVMELHEMQRDELPDNPLPEVKTRKLLKKKRPRPGQEQGAANLSSSSGSSIVPPGPEKQEEFFDAHESYTELPGVPETQTSATAIPPRTVISKTYENPEALRLGSPAINPDDKPLPAVPAISDATTAAATQDTATGQTPITSAKPIRQTNPE